jgi:DNA-binding MarR family transcriptional regulator
MSSILENNTSDDEYRANLIRDLQYLGQMASTETALFHQTAAAKWGLGITDIKTLSILTQERSMTAGDMALRLGLTTGAVTNVIDRLERKDLVRRERDAKDRRKVIVVANREQLSKSENVYKSIGKAFDGLQAMYSTEELAFLVRYQRAAIETTRNEIQKLINTTEK